MAVDVSVKDSKYLHVDITGPQNANRLFIYSGIIYNNFSALGDDWYRTTIKIELGEQRVLSKCDNYGIDATAWPSGIGDNTKRYAIDSVKAYYSNVEGRLILEVAIAVAGNGGRLYQIGYQVIVRTHCAV